MEDKKELAKEIMPVFLNSGFSIMLLGERGTGKSKLVEEAIKSEKEKGSKKKYITGEFLEANCASFADDTMAEAELFGYVPGAFTGALKNGKIGLFKEAENGILFLDEIHNLSKCVQAKLMTALQTDDNNKMRFRPLGSNKKIYTSFILIVATNKSIDELRGDILLLDFYDRIVQNVIEIPSLRETKEDIEQNWKNTWKKMKFDEEILNSKDFEKDSELIKWLKDLPLYGNFRDLQKIAIYYNDFKNFDEKLKKMIPEETPLNYAKSQFEKWKSPEPNTEENSVYLKLDLTKTKKEIEKDFKFKLQEWAIKQYVSKKKAADKLGVDKKTLDNWKNMGE